VAATDGGRGDDCGSTAARPLLAKVRESALFPCGRTRPPRLPARASGKRRGRERVRGDKDRHEDAPRRIRFDMIASCIASGEKSGYADMEHEPIPTGSIAS